MTDLLLLPGLLCDARLWQAQAADLADLASAVVPALTEDDRIEAMAARVLAAAPPRFALAALSMGGYVALEMLRQAPERIARVALFDTSARPDRPEQARRRRGLIALARGELGQGGAVTGFRGVTPRLLPELLHPRHLDGPLPERVQAMAAAVGREAFLRQQEAILHRIDQRPLLPTLRLPALVAVGEADRLTPPALAAELAAAIPGARLAVIPACGHLPPLEDPPAVSALLRAWLVG